MTIKERNNAINNVRLIEDRLNTLYFRNIQLGSLVAHALIVFLVLQQGKVNLRQSLKYLLSTHLVLLKVRFGRRSNNVKKPGSKILFTLIGNDNRFKDLIFPLIIGLGGNVTTLLSMEKLNESEINTQLIKFDYSNLELKRYQALELRLAYKKMLKELIELKNSGIIKGLQINVISNFVLNAMLKVSFCEQLLQSSPVKCIVTELDRDTKVSAPLIEVAKKMGIKTITLIHGSTEPPDVYYPVLADYLLCWGKRHVEQFAALGESREKLIIVGNHKVKRNKMPKSPRKLEIGYYEIMLVTNSIPDNYREDYFRAFIDAIQKLEKCSGLVKIHPREEKCFYEKLLSKSDIKRIRIADNTNFDNRNLEGVTLAVCHHSNYNYELVIEGVPVIVLDNIDYPLGNGKVLVKEAGVPAAKDAQELTEIIHNLLTDPEEYSKLISGLTDFSYKLVAFSDKEALHKTLDFVKAIV
jgi:glycosyltransferase involved in cell wall biosynthesis